MALINCSECSSKISSTANGCPKCGAPVVLEKTESPNVVAPTSAVERKSKSKIIFLIVGVIIMVIGAGAFLYIKQRPSPEERAAKEKMKQDSIVAAFNAEATVAVTAALEKSRQDALATDEAQKAAENNSNTDGNPNNIFPAQYMAVSKKAYFYDSPDASTARKSFIIKEQTITIFREDGDYYYGSFTYNGRTTEGFMQKKDLQYIK